MAITEEDLEKDFQRFRYKQNSIRGGVSYKRSFSQNQK